MRRTTLILIIVLAVVVIGGGAYVWLKKDSLTFPWAKNTNTSTTTGVGATTTNVSTNTAPKTITLPSEVKGDTAVAGTLKVGTVDIKINSQQKQATADGQTVDKGQTYLLVYFDAVNPADVAVVDRGIRDAKIINGTASYPLLALKVASTYVSGDRGYLRFAVPEKATNLVLQLGTGATAQTVKLP